MEKVSIILPTYNRAYCISKAIDSVMNQTCQDFVLIIVDDGSTDNTSGLVSQYRQQYGNQISYIRLEQNEGVANARNIGMRHAAGEYIAFQDSDDYWVKDKLEKQLCAIEETGADFSYTYIKYMVDEQRTVVVPDACIEQTKMSGDIYGQLLYGNMIGAPTLVMKRKCYEAVGEFDRIFPALEDYEYALRLARDFKAAFVGECLLEAALTDDGVSSNGTNDALAGCMLVGRYKKDLLAYNAFNHQVEVICENAKKLGIEGKILPFLEKMIVNPV